MSDYHNVRGEIKGIVEERFRLIAQKKDPDTTHLEELFTATAESMLDKFEHLAIGRNVTAPLPPPRLPDPFMRGVWQSFLGSLLFLLALALFAFLIYGNKQNPFRILTDDLPPSTPPHKSSPTPGEGAKSKPSE